MVNKSAEKLIDAFPDFNHEVANPLDQILNNISTQIAEQPASENDFLQERQQQTVDYYNGKINQTIHDIMELEASAVEIIQANIDNLYKGTYVHDCAKRYCLSEEQIRDELRHDLANQFRSWGMKLVNKKHYALNREIKHIIRMDYYGTVDSVKDKNKFSDTYRKRNPEETIFYKPSDYDLSKSPAWMVFSQFRSFKLLERNLPQQLIDEGIPAYELARLNTSDFSQILYNHYINKSRPNAKDNERADLFLGAKYRFVKTFIRHKEAEVQNYMDFIGTDPRYTKALIKHMQITGTTCNFDVFEDAYTPEMIKELKHRKLINDNVQAGDPITEKQAEIIKANGMLGQIVARDQEGNPITGPKITVHHKTAVQDCGEKTNFAKVNSFENLCLMVEPYHYFAHSMDRTAMQDSAEYYVSRIEIGKKIAFYGGFNELFQIEHDFGKAHYNSYNHEALETFQNKELYFSNDNTYWETHERKPRKEKKQQKSAIINQTKKLFPAEDAEKIDNIQTSRKKEKNISGINPFFTLFRKQKLKEAEERKQDILLKRREYLTLRAIRNAARHAIETSLNPPKSKGITIILPEPSADNEDNLKQKPQDTPAAATQKREKKKPQKKQSQTLPVSPKIIISADNILSDTQSRHNLSKLVSNINNDESVSWTTVSITKTMQNKKRHKPDREDDFHPTEEQKYTRTEPTQSPSNTKKKKEKRETPKNKTVIGNKSSSYTKNIARQQFEKQQRINELEQIRAEAMAKIAAKKAIGEAITPIDDEEKIRRTIQYMLRQREKN